MGIPTRATLEEMIRDNIPESITLDYKRSDALGRENTKRNEIGKDVSAFANSAGGMLIYGIPETDQLPQPLDTGVDKTVISREWIEQVLNSTIQPRIAGIRITQIEADMTDKVYYVIEVPQASTFAPHQAFDKKYYKRFNFQSVPMEDYEIRDALRRSSDPLLRIDFGFDNDQKHELIRFETSRIIFDVPYSDGISLWATVHNDSSVPAKYLFMEIFIHPAINVMHSDSLRSSSRVVPTSSGDRLLKVVSIRLGLPNNMPVFQEAPEKLSEPIILAVQMHSAFAQEPVAYPFGYRIRCPGCLTERWGTLQLHTQVMRIEID